MDTPYGPNKLKPNSNFFVLESKRHKKQLSLISKEQAKSLTIHKKRININMRVVRQLDEEIWRNFVEDNPYGNIFHTPEMFQVFSKTKGHKPDLWAVFDNNSQMLALLTPVQITLMDGFMRYLTTRSIAYGSILGAPNRMGLNAQELLLSTYTQQTNSAKLFTELRNLSEISASQLITLEKCGFVYEEHQNYLIDLGIPIEQVWQKISKSARKKIRQAECKNDLIIEELRNPERLPIWYALLEKSYAHAQVPLADYSLFKAAFDILFSKGMIQFLLGRVEDTYVAASVALLYKDRIYGWYRGFERAYGKYLPNDLMVWHVLKWGAENGYNCFDFGGAGKPSEEYGPRRFKAKFGGSLVSYGRNIYVHTPWFLALSKVGYQFYRRLIVNH